MAQTKELKTTYEVGGNEVTLTPSSVCRYLAKGNAQLTEQEVVMFMSLCKFNRLNPFLNEAYIVKYGDQPAQMVTSKEAYFKRAEANPHYRGIEAGIIVQTKEGDIVERDGAFQAPGDILLGGWARVFRDDRDVPVTAKVNLAEYDKQRSTWNQIKSTMIAKVAKAQALREAFPSELGALYTPEETRYTETAQQQTATAAAPETESGSPAGQAVEALRKAQAKASSRRKAHTAAATEQPTDVEAEPVEATPEEAAPEEAAPPRK